MGDKLGFNDGASVGTAVGAQVGLPCKYVGIRLGDTLGIHVGDEVGLGVGSPFL